MQISFQSNIEAARKRLHSMHTQTIPQATKDALNGTMGIVRTASVKRISAKTSLKQKDVRERMTWRKASTSFLATGLSVREKRVPNLSRFLVGSTKGQIKKAKKTGKRPPVRAKAWGKTRTYKGAFVWSRQTKKGGVASTVFKRVGKERHPLKPLFGPSVKRAFASDESMKVMSRVAKANFQRILGKQIQRQVDKTRNKYLKGSGRI